MLQVAPDPLGLMLNVWRECRGLSSGGCPGYGSWRRWSKMADKCRLCRSNIRHYCRPFGTARCSPAASGAASFSDPPDGLAPLDGTTPKRMVEES